MKRLRGLKDLVQDGVESTTNAVEKVHTEIAKKPFEILEMVPPLAPPVKAVQMVHDTIVGTVYGSIRLITKIVGATTGVLLDVMVPPEKPSIKVERAESEPPKTEALVEATAEPLVKAEAVQPAPVKES